MADPEKIEAADALLVVDVQTAFVSGAGAVVGHEGLLLAVEALIERARADGAPVLFLQHDGPTGAVDEPFRPGWSLHFTPASHEPVVRKKQDNGFAGTNLDRLLQGFKVRKLAICGVLSEMCVAATARAAMVAGYEVVLPHDAHATYDVPAGPGSQGVPAAMAARAAEWSLGDGIRICASAASVRFR